MIQRREEEDGPTMWTFRHDKITEFFLAQHFLCHQDELIEKYFDDPRFRGVYLILVEDLPIDQATQLRESLVERAAHTNDNTLSNEIVLRLLNREQRKVA